MVECGFDYNRLKVVLFTLYQTLEVIWRAQVFKSPQPSPWVTCLEDFICLVIFCISSFITNNP
jgi:hypothetical protein